MTALWWLGMSLLMLALLARRTARPMMMVGLFVLTQNAALFVAGWRP